MFSREPTLKSKKPAVIVIVVRCSLSSLDAANAANTAKVVWSEDKLLVSGLWYHSLIYQDWEYVSWWSCFLIITITMWSLHYPHSKSHWKVAEFSTNSILPPKSVKIFWQHFNSKLKHFHQSIFWWWSNLVLLICLI